MRCESFRLGSDRINERLRQKAMDDGGAALDALSDPVGRAAVGGIVAL